MGPKRVSQFPGPLRLAGWDTPALFPGSNTRTHTHTVLNAWSHCLRRLEWYWKKAILVCRSLNKPLQLATSHPPSMQPLLGGDRRERTANADLLASETEASL